MGYCWILLDIDIYCWILSDIDWILSNISLDIVKYCQLLSDIFRYWQHLAPIVRLAIFFLLGHIGYLNDAEF